MTIDQLKAYKRKAKAQRDNWKRRAILAENELSAFRKYIENIDAWYKELCELCGVPTKSLVKQPPPLTVCPSCGGPADNGFDRCSPPNPYYCSKCENK